MTHHTDTERAEFEAWYIAGARKSVPAFAEWSEIELREGCMRPDSGSYRIDYARIAWDAWQAARRAPAVPQGWKITEEMHLAAVKVLHRASGVDGLPQRMVDAMLAAAPQPPEATVKQQLTVEAAPVQLPEPVAYLYHDAPTLEDYLANERAGIPINSACIGVKRMPHCRNETPLYTEQQVRQLLAAHGIEEPK